MMQLQSGAFTFDTKRPFLCVHSSFRLLEAIAVLSIDFSLPALNPPRLPQLQQRPNLCNIQANAPYKPGNALPLHPQLVAHDALSRFHVALVMVLGAPMQV
jgi:hypothetical protein